MEGRLIPSLSVIVEWWIPYFLFHKKWSTSFFCNADYLRKSLKNDELNFILSMVTMDT